MDAMRYLAVAVSPLLLSSRSSDNALQSAADAARRVWTPRLGYNLETLYADALHMASNRRTMS